IRVTGPVGHRLLADEVAAPEVRGVEAEPPRRAVEETVEHEGGLGAAGAAVRAHERLVRDDVDALAGEVRHAVRPGQMIDRVQADHVAQRRVGAVIAREARLDRGERAVATGAEPRAVPLVAVGRRREEVLAPRLDPLHRPGAPGASARSTLAAAGRGSHVTRTASAPSAAWYASSAITTATASPAWRATASAMAA